MAFLQKKFFYQTKFKPSLITQRLYKSNSQKGFINLFLLPLIALMMTGVIGLASLSIGIKHITQTQSTCIKNNIKGKIKLGLLLKQILNLNEKVLKLHKTRQVFQAKLAVAVSTGQIKLILSLRKTLSLIKKGQALLMLKQQYILNQSQLVKVNTLKKLKKDLQILPVSKIQEKTFFTKALALEKKREGDKAYTYKPAANFTERQKSRFLWKMNPFYPLNISRLIFKQKKTFQYQCTASLTKKGHLWISHLYH